MCQFVSFLISFIVATALALCPEGIPGRDGQVINVPFAALLNGTGESTVAVTQAGPCTNVVLDSVNTLVLCAAQRGPTGDPGLPGASGSDGVPEDITFVPPDCLHFGFSGLDICNGSAQTGPAGPAGIQGPTSTVRGPIGKPPAARIALVGTGYDYPPTRAGLQSAVDTLAAGGGGTVNVAASRIVSDGTSLFLKTGVMVDFMGSEFALSPDSASYALVATSFATGAANLFTQQLNELSTVARVSPWSGSQWVAGDLGYISGPNTGFGFAGNVFEPIVVASADGTTGTINLRSPAGRTWVAGAGNYIIKILNPVQDTGMRNAVLNTNGNTGTGSQAMFLQGVQRLYLKHITLTGVSGATNTAGLCSGICVAFTSDAVIRNIRSRDYMDTEASGGMRDISVQYPAAATVVDLQSVSSNGFGPNIANGQFSVVNGIRTQFQQARGYRVDTGTYSAISNIITDNHKTNRGVGLFMASFGASINTLRNVVAFGSEELGIGVQGSPPPIAEVLNQLYGFVSFGNPGGVGINNGNGNNAVGNFFMGNTNAGLYSLGPNDPLPSSYYIDTCCGLTAEYLHVNLPATADFPAGDTSSWFMVTNNGASSTNSTVVFNVRCPDGVVRRVTLGIA